LSSFSDARRLERLIALNTPSFSLSSGVVTQPT
jgi:hypothetical protein